MRRDSGLYVPGGAPPPTIGMPPPKRGLREMIRDLTQPRAVAHSMDGPWWHDTRSPFTADPTKIAAVTLAATAKALYTVAAFPNLGGGYFNWVGKAIRIEMMGRMTTAATPGNGSFNIHWGTGADANGTLICAAGTPVALVANGTTLPWWMTVDIICVSTGATGTLFAQGWAQFHVGLILSTAAPIFIPASAPAVSAALDLTVANNNIPSVQYLRSGSTAETMQVHMLRVTSLN